jgi:hypothetical protein
MDSAQHSRRAELNPRLFWVLLIVTAFIGLVIRIDVGRKTVISFDEWQHLFMAGSARWSDLSYELRTNAHPPLFFLLLRGILKLRNVALYRSVSIASGVGSIVVVGLIARKLFRSPAVQLLCAAVFALSADAISISAEIRSYQLTVFLVLLAFLFWLGMFHAGDKKEEDGKTRTRSGIGFAICVSLAVSSHYSAVFFLAACLIVSVARIVKSRLWPVAAAMLVPCTVFAVEYFVHASVQPVQGYLADYYFGGTPGETWLSFAIRNFGNFFNLFSPIELHSPSAFIPVILLLCAAGAWALMTPARSRPAILLAAVMTVELLAAALARKYPFGGMLRHQYIVGPFLLIAGFAILDTLIPATAVLMRRAVAALVLAASIGNLIARAPSLILYPGVTLMQEEFNTWNSAFPDAPAIYLDHWSVIAWFIFTSDRPRSFVRNIPDPDSAVIDEYHVPGGSANGTDIFYDKTRGVVSLSDPSLYRSFAACLRASGHKELVLFFMSPGEEPIDRNPAGLERGIVQRAADQGLIASGIVIRRTSLAAGFQLRPSE